MSLPYRPLSRRARLATALAAALAVHVVAIPIVASQAVFHLPKDKRLRNISLLRQSPSQVRRTTQGIRAQGPASPSLQPPALPPALEEEKPTPVKPPEPVRIDGQIVSLGPPTDERPPDQPTKYLSERDSRVAKETRARETSAFFKNALSKATKEGETKKRAPAAPPEEKPSAPPAGAPPSSAPSGGAQLAQAPAPELPSRARQDRVQLPEAASGTVKNRAAADAIRGEGRKVALARPSDQKGPQQAQGAPGAGGPQLPPGVPNGAERPLNLTLQRPLDTLGPVAGGPMSDDLKQVDVGEETLLNSRSFRYAGYLNRVKETVGRIWSLDVQQVAMRRDPTGDLFLYKDRRTVVEFTLDKSGEIRDVKVSLSSGVDYLDRVAVDAFKKAERFPNPPSGLLGIDGQITLPFAFTLMAATGGARIQMGPAYLPGSPAQRGW